MEQRSRESEVTRRRLSAVIDSSASVRQGIERAIADFNGLRGDPASFDKLESLLADQAYRLCHWRVATDEINYRRFFDINELAGVRVERAEVFEAVHRFVGSLIAKGDLQEPRWPENVTYDELIKRAFDGRVIDRPEHEVIRRLSGEVV